MESSKGPQPASPLLAQVAALRIEAAARHAEVLRVQAMIDDQVRLMSDVADFLAALDETIDAGEAAAS